MRNKKSLKIRLTSQEPERLHSKTQRHYLHFTNQTQFRAQLFSLASASKVNHNTKSFAFVIRNTKDWLLLNYEGYTISITSRQQTMSSNSNTSNQIVRLVGLLNQYAHCTRNGFIIVFILLLTDFGASERELYMA